MPFIYEEGEEVLTGSHGEHDFVFAEGDPVPDAGLSELVFEEGTGIGGAGILLAESTTGIHDSGETHTGFYNYKGNESNFGTWDSFHAVGLDNGVSPSWAAPSNNRGTRNALVGLHYDQPNDNYGVVLWFPGTDGDNGNWEVQAVFRDLGDVASGVVIHDGADYGESPDAYATDNGDPAPYWGWSWDPTDGCIVGGIPPGTSASFSLILQDPPVDQGRNDQPDAIIAYGPNGVYDEVSFTGYGQAIDFTLSV